MRRFWIQPLRDVWALFEENRIRRVYHSYMAAAMDMERASRDWDEQRPLKKYKEVLTEQQKFNQSVNKELQKMPNDASWDVSAL